MKGFIALVLILGFVSPCLCTRLKVGTENAIYNVIQYGARGDGKTDDSQVDVSLNFSL